MKGISTVGILILTVFLSISVLPACADPNLDLLGHPVMVVGYAESDGEPVVDATVTICDVNDASKCTTVQVGVSYGTPGYWKADLFPIGVGDGETVRVTITANDGSSIGSAIYIVNTSSPETSRVSDITLTPPLGTPGGGSGSGEGTYPPGWGETPTPAPTPDATVTPASTETTKPSVTTPDEDRAVTPGEAVTEGEATAEETEPTTELKTPGFGAVFMIAGMLAAVYLVLRRRE